ncbi:Photosystem II reaction center X protein [Capsicum baccatum]|uniref:Photosystem II reaction center X protein n=1 Tax=Capsicum baccatum TaxID=33114 RepID=A0A2G2X3Z0_CAPBA|nr:Photosystem II reaction center X protein [Capsicum baccatum]
MASTSSIVSMAMPPTYTSQNKQPIVVESFFKPLPIRPSKQIATSKSTNKFVVIKASSSSSMKEKAVAGLSAGLITATMVVPDVAQAADGVSPSLKNFLLSIVSGGVVLFAILGAVIGVSNFDPVKRG